MKNTASLETQAVNAALKGAWDQAILLNQKIIKLEKDNSAALNRLAYAFWKNNDLNAAKKTYHQVLAIDAHNTIATKNLNRLTTQKKKATNNQKGQAPTGIDIFLEEPGKTRLVKLVRLASESVLANLDCAEEVLLKAKKHQIHVNNQGGIRLGSLPDDLAHRLQPLIAGGNQYQAFIKSADRHQLEIIIKEVKKAPKFKDYPSFSTNLPTAVRKRQR
jgi:tetratricopeptide (TPR) repeat protein